MDIVPAVKLIFHMHIRRKHCVWSARKNGFMLKKIKERKKKRKNSNCKVCYIHSSIIHKYNFEVHVTQVFTGHFMLLYISTPHFWCFLLH